MQPMLCFKLWQNLATGIIVLAIPKSQNTRVLGNGGIQNIGKPKTLGCQSSYTYYLAVRHMGCFRCHLICFAVICPSHDDFPPRTPCVLVTPHTKQCVKNFGTDLTPEISVLAMLKALGICVMVPWYPKYRIWEYPKHWGISVFIHSLFHPNLRSGIFFFQGKRRGREREEKICLIHLFCEPPTTPTINKLNCLSSVR